MVIVPLKVKTENRMRMDNITTNLMNLYHKLAIGCSQYDGDGSVVPVTQSIIQNIEQDSPLGG